MALHIPLADASSSALRFKNVFTICLADWLTGTRDDQITYIHCDQVRHTF